MEAALKAIGELPAGQQIPLIMETLITSQKAVKDLQAKVQQLGAVETETVEGITPLEASGTQQVAKFTKSFAQKAKTPTMSVGMSFSKYKYSVESWQRMVLVPKRDQAILLVNSLPDNDYYGGLKDIIVKNIGWSAIQCEQGVENVLAEIDKTIRSADFVRLMKWEKRWVDLEQGSQSIEDHMSTLREMVREAEEDFDFVVPAKMVAAKMLSSCNAVTTENIGNIIAKLDLAGDGRNIDHKVERRLKYYCNAVHQLGAQQIDEVFFQDTDINGGRRGSSEVSHEGSDKKKESYEERRKRCLDLNLCFGCEQPTYVVGHKSAECPVSLAKRSFYEDRKKRKSGSASSLNFSPVVRGPVSSQRNSSQSSTSTHQKVKFTSRPRVKAPETVVSGEVNDVDLGGCLSRRLRLPSLFVLLL